MINAAKKIQFGDDVLIGWRCTLIDGDGHGISYGKGSAPKTYEEINIGNHVWLASEVSVLKGSSLLDGSVVASKGCITKKFDQENILIGGFNKVLRQDVKWER